MTFLRFLAYEKPYIFLYLTIFLITAAVFFTEYNSDWSWGTFFYALSLSSIVLLGFLLFRYHQNIRVIRQMINENDETLSLEGEFAKAYIDELRKEHIREMNRIQDRQKEHYDFIVSWFHEIKTPIAVLRLLEQTEMDPSSIREEIAKIENYVDQALYYAKLDSFNQDYDIQNCDCIQIVKEIVKGHAKTFFSKKIRINIQADFLEVQSDPKWLQFIINQLVTNSLKYTEPGGEISISVLESLEEKQLLICDNGIGISQKDLPRIFNRGFTGETGRTHTKSTGMGLYLAQQLSKKLGHYITCTSKVGVYTQFIIHFPQDSDPYLLLQKNT
ncbi:sensor histidine kinase [Neobacillus thermocopriae]|uniref:histidine kinase n=1 Tax=Neobacillus thermocopriae TaxID=1215031 RepID=A0A6B3TRM0_9BACI|nr:sensor histidine kinase [Neobacillus thermocopriae]MED3623813.1 sensor histidine kinase [Neobacillus thermocopriae]MED3712978.1 sensor histidine kinase [Neobacillus thermocopriae]NEX79086.1 HAMP domain-containing histidine kinase [Neobacillus thermocopriae]